LQAHQQVRWVAVKSVILKELELPESSNAFYHYKRFITISAHKLTNKTAKALSHYKHTQVNKASKTIFIVIIMVVKLASHLVDSSEFTFPHTVPS